MPVPKLNSAIAGTWALMQQKAQFEVVERQLTYTTGLDGAVKRLREMRQRNEIGEVVSIKASRTQSTPVQARGSSAAAHRHQSCIALHWSSCTGDALGQPCQLCALLMRLCILAATRVPTIMPRLPCHVPAFL